METCVNEDAIIPEDLRIVSATSLAAQQENLRRLASSNYHQLMDDMSMSIRAPSSTSSSSEPLVVDDRGSPSRKMKGKEIMMGTNFNCAVCGDKVRNATVDPSSGTP